MSPWIWHKRLQRIKEKNEEITAQSSLNIWYVAMLNKKMTAIKNKHDKLSVSDVFADIE